MSDKTVRFTLDPDNSSPLTETDKALLEALANRPELAIDYSDIPPMPLEFFRQAERGRWYRPIKS